LRRGGGAGDAPAWLPLTFVPGRDDLSERAALAAAHDARGGDGRAAWILKPSDGGKGARIAIFDDLAAIDAHVRAAAGSVAWVASAYLGDPLLLEPGGRKFDVRIWVLVDADFGVHVWRRGVLRTCSVPFSNDRATFGDPFDWVALGLLGATRTLAYLCYPLLMLLFLGKANNLVCALSRSVVGVYVPFHRLHELHTSAGVVAGAAFVAHGAGHAARWARQGNARLLWASQTGRTGAVAALLTPLIVVPMRSAACRAALRWELRKALHYLAVLWGLLAALHAPKSVSLPCVAIPLAVYAGDWLYGLLFRTYLVRTS
ncbi:hypothetical protein AURANDRAFT_68832, partial [Aureococcus anophagefferens]